MTNFNEMGKKELRAACKAAGMKGYSKLTVAMMRIDLANHAHREAGRVITTLKDVSASVDGHTGTGLKVEKNRQERNGIKRPSAGGKCRAVWDALDGYVAEEKEAPTSKIVKMLAADEGWNVNNAVIEFYQWRKFNAIK